MTRLTLLAVLALAAVAADAPKDPTPASQPARKSLLDRAKEGEVAIGMTQFHVERAMEVTGQKLVNARTTEEAGRKTVEVWELSLGRPNHDAKWVTFTNGIVTRIER